MKPIKTFLFTLIFFFSFIANIFATIYGSGDGFFGTIDTTTGAMTAITTNWPKNISIASNSLGTIYVSGNGIFGTVDKTTGVITNITTTWNKKIIAFDTVNNLYTSSTSSLKTINASTGATISTITNNLPKNMKINFYTIKANTLYGSSDGFFGTIDTTTGERTAITNNWAKDTYITFDSSGNCYGSSDGFFGTVNRLTGAKTSITTNFPPHISITYVSDNPQ